MNKFNRWIDACTGLLDVANENWIFVCKTKLGFQWKRPSKVGDLTVYAMGGCPMNDMYGLMHD